MLSLDWPQARLYAGLRVRVRLGYNSFDANVSFRCSNPVRVRFRCFVVTVRVTDRVRVRKW